jgi:hypothetical protein
MKTDWVEKTIDNATVLFSKWRTGRVKLWDYTPTHRTATLRVQSTDVPGNLHIVCGGCTSMCGPFSWDNCELQVEQRAEEGGGMRLFDAGVNFEIRCGVVSVEENVDPVYTPRLGVLSGKE